MKKFNLNYKNLFFCSAITIFQAKANLYIGLGTSISNDSYSANSEDLGQTQNLQNVSKISSINLIQYNGTFSQFIENIKYNIPNSLSNVDKFNSTLFSKFDDASNEFKGCIGESGYMVSSYGIDACNNSKAKYQKLTLGQFYQDIGSSVLYNIEKNDNLFKDRLTSKSKNKLSEEIGREIISSIITSQNSNINMSKITIDDINKWFGGSSETILFKIDKNLFGLDSGALSLTAIEMQTDIIGEYQDKWNVIAAGVENALLKNQNLVYTNSVIKSSASSSKYGVILSLGYLTNVGSFFYGGELAFDIGKYSIGKNQDLELEVSYNLGASLVGRVGFYLFDKSLAYLNMGLNLRDYAVSGFGISADGIIPHYIIGVGSEIFIYKNMNIFLEFNHVVSMAKLDTGVIGAKSLALKSNKINVGFRLYLDTNALNDISFHKSKDHEKASQGVQVTLKDIKIK